MPLSITAHRPSGLIARLMAAKLAFQPIRADYTPAYARVIDPAPSNPLFPNWKTQANDRPGSSRFFANLRGRKKRIGLFTAAAFALSTPAGHYVSYTVGSTTILGAAYGLTMLQQGRSMDWQDFRQNSGMWLSVLLNDTTLAYNVAALLNRDATIICFPVNEDGTPAQDQQLACHSPVTRAKKGGLAP